MSKTAVVVDSDYLKHQPGEFHPERPERIQVLLDLAGELDSEKFRILPPKAATRRDIESCHGADYIALVESTSKTNQYALDGDTITCRDSFATGLLAVDGFLLVQHDRDWLATSQAGLRSHQDSYYGLGRPSW